MKRSSVEFLRAHPRLVFWLFALLGASLTAYEWHAVRSGNFYHPMAAVFGPWCAISFAVLGVFPRLAGKPAPEEKTKKAVQGILLVLGLGAGLFNWYAMTR